MLKKASCDEMSLDLLDLRRHTAFLNRNAEEGSGHEKSFGRKEFWWILQHLKISCPLRVNVLELREQEEVFRVLLCEGLRFVNECLQRKLLDVKVHKHEEGPWDSVGPSVTQINETQQRTMEIVKRSPQVVKEEQSSDMVNELREKVPCNVSSKVTGLLCLDMLVCNGTMNCIDVEGDHGGYGHNEGDLIWVIPIIGMLWNQCMQWDCMDVVHMASTNDGTMSHIMRQADASVGYIGYAINVVMYGHRVHEWCVEIWSFVSGGQHVKTLGAWHQ
ncbi:hypothetical protein Ancab_008028 [Ancistrocladus abbreviatus]